MKPYISRLVSIYGIRWNIYHMLLVKLRDFIAKKLRPFWAIDVWSKLQFAPVMSEKHLKHT